MTQNFSERIWGNKEKIIQEAHTEISRNILKGGDLVFEMTDRAE